MSGIPRQPIRSIAFVVFCAWTGIAYAAPTTYVLDQEHTTVRFIGRAMGHRFTGTAPKVEGAMQFDPEQGALLRPAEIVISVEMMETGNRRRDRDMRAMFEAERHPALRFTADEITRLDGEPVDAGAPQRFQLSGRLQIRSIEQPVAFEMLATVSPARIEASGQTVLTITAFALKPPRLLLGLVRVDEHVRVMVTSRWERQP